MKYRALSFKGRMGIYMLLSLIFTLFAVSFVSIFIDVNQRGINALDILFEWLIYIVLLSAFSAVFISIVNANHDLTEDYLILRLGFLGFVRIQYSNIKSVSKYDGKLPLRGIHIIENTCYMFLERNNLIKIQLHKPVKVNYFILIRRYTDTIVFSSDRRENFIQDLIKKI